MLKRSNALIAILLLATAALACSLLRPKRPLTWHLLLEIDAPATNRVAALRQAIFVTEKRLDALGVSNWAIKVQGDESDGRYLVSVSDVPDRERLRRVLIARGKLELVHGPEIRRTARPHQDG